jgi:NDP-sugar pyrophosphorylase family protein
MKAMIFAAGLGTRLRPLTHTVPKALVPVCGTPMLQIAVDKLKKAGVKELIINVHHHAEQILDFLKSNHNFGIRIETSDERDQLLDTGGGIKKASWFFDDDKPFFIYNVDILCGTDLSALYNFHLNHKGIATLLVRHRSGNRYLLFDDNMHLCGWTNTQTGEVIASFTPRGKTSQLAFSSVHVVNPEIFQYMNEVGAFSIRDFYLKIAANHSINGYLDDETPWIDIGTPERLKEAEKVYEKMNS